MQKRSVAKPGGREDRQSADALIDVVDCVAPQLNHKLSVFCDHCRHRGAFARPDADTFPGMAEEQHPEIRSVGRLLASVELMQVLARARGYDRRPKISTEDAKTRTHDVSDVVYMAHGSLAA